MPLLRMEKLSKNLIAHSFIRYSEEKPKIPFAQPRTSVSSTSGVTGDSVYLNYSDTKKSSSAKVIVAHEDPDNDGK